MYHLKEDIEIIAKCYEKYHQAILMLDLFEIEYDAMGEEERQDDSYIDVITKQILNPENHLNQLVLNMSMAKEDMYTAIEMFLPFQAKTLNTLVSRAAKDHTGETVEISISEYVYIQTALKMYVEDKNLEMLGEEEI